MSPVIHQTHRHYFMGACRKLSARQLQKLASAFAKPPSPQNNKLAGRESVAFISLPEIGPVVIKHYFRGGLIQHVNRRTYFNWPRTRGEKEFEWLRRVRQLGLAAPQPIAFASTGRFIGKCWLVTTAIPNYCALSQIHDRAETRRLAAYRRARQQVQILVANGIWHRDLHPGNILIDEKDVAHIIDFDKARYLDNRRQLTARYINRWKRAIAKHRLSPELELVMKLEAITA